MTLPISYRLALVIFPILFSLPAQADNLDATQILSDVKRILKADVRVDGNDETILIGKRHPDDRSPILFVFEADTLLTESQRALLPVENAYSPASFDGFEVETVSSDPNLTRIIDVQGEGVDLVYPSFSGDKLILKSVEEDNGRYNFNVQFSFDEDLADFIITNVFLNTNNTRCDQGLISVFAFPDSPLSDQTLQDFDGREAFHELKELNRDFQTGRRQATKLMPKEVSTSFEQALAAFKANEYSYFKEIMGSFLVGGRDGLSCSAEDYIVAKYYFPENPRWSNDLGFLFEQSGYLKEAATLLGMIVEKHPDRVVTYLNLADSYWALGNVERAILMYKKYMNLMGERKSRVPERVLERINLEQLKHGKENDSTS